MEENGWQFRNIGQTFETRSGIHADKCGKDTWYGWKTSESKGNASVSVVFFNSGSARLVYENCHIKGTVDVFLNHSHDRIERKVASAEAGSKGNQVAFEFFKGTALNITTEGGIVNLKSLTIKCKGNISAFIYRL